jgi:hypothetical protein
VSVKDELALSLTVAVGSSIVSANAEKKDTIVN